MAANTAPLSENCTQQTRVCMCARYMHTLWLSRSHCTLARAILAFTVAQRERSMWINGVFCSLRSLLRACWKIHKTATNITHSHYSLTHSLARVLALVCGRTLSSTVYPLPATGYRLPAEWFYENFWPFVEQVAIIPFLFKSELRSWIIYVNAYYTYVYIHIIRIFT